MKKIRLLAFSLAAALLLGVTASAVTVTVGHSLTGKDGAVLGAAFVDKNGRTMVPLRAVADLLNLTVTWDGATKAATFTDGETVAVFTQGANHFTADGRAVPMDAAVVNVDGRVYAPARCLAETFGVSITWDADARAVILGEADVKWLVQQADTVTSDGTRATTRYTYDAAGRLLTCVYTDGARTTTETYTYTAAGFIASYVYSDRDRWTSSSYYTYDAAGNMASSHIVDSNGNDDAHVYTYDAKGNPLTCDSRSKSGAVSHKRYTYHAAGHTARFEETGVTAKGASYQILVTYDDDGCILTNDVTYPDRAYRETYTYDAKHRKAAVSYVGDDSVYTDSYAYDRFDRVIAVTHVENGVTTTTGFDTPPAAPAPRCTYDAHGNIKTETVTDGARSVTTTYYYTAITA
ncbi:MAG: stalk domain-containing protein [Oscillospiraceae bacterium]|nr:stalk domain-containing protein [Oscillospiraceae bacterium]